MAFTDPKVPNLTDFLTYAIDQGVPSADLPPWSPYPAYALNYAQEVALPGAPRMGSPNVALPGPYVMAVYNLALHQLIMTCPDQVARAVFSVTITNGGSGYTTAPTVTFSAAPTGGTTAAGTAVLTGDAVTSVDITTTGAGYTAAPTVTFSAPASGTTATGTTTLTTAQTFFVNYRKINNLLSFQSGVVLGSGDQNTSNTLVVPELYRKLPLYAQDLLRTLWGRQYLSYAQTYGPTIVGIS